MARRNLGGVGAARLAGQALGLATADELYSRAAMILGLYTVAFYGERGSAAERRRLRDAWREARAIASLRGTLPPSFR